MPRFWSKALSDPPRISSVARYSSPDKAPKPIVVNRLQFKRDGAGYLDERRTHIHVFDVESKESFQLTNAQGDTTSHIQGMFNRTVKYMQEGIKPVFVFDGKPPQLKSGELVKRREKREKAQAALKVAAEEGDADLLLEGHPHSHALGST